MSLDINVDYADMLVALEAEGVEFVIVGAYALAAHGQPRATGDIDILLRPSPENAARVYRALVRFGAPIDAHGVKVSDFEQAGTVYQIGLPPRRIDLLTGLTDVSFDEAIDEAIEGALAGQRVMFIGRRAFIRNKRATGRTKDLADAELLEALDDG